MRLRVDVWSDIACPWCYVGKRRLEAALARFAHARDVEVVWRAFELDPASPAVRDPRTGYSERLAGKYGTSPAQAEAMIRRMTEVAAAEGLSFDFEHIQPGNTFDAHRLLHRARARGVQDAVKERFLRAYLCEGQAIGERAVLARLAAEAGVGAEDAAEVLATEAHAAEVRADEAEARALGVGGVPFFLLGARYGVAGAHPAEALLEALRRAWAEPAEDAAPEGPVCGPEGCD